VVPSDEEPLTQFDPTLSAVMPTDWFVKESITLLHPKGRANVIASSEPLDAQIDTEKYAGVQGDVLEAEFNGYEELAFEPKRIFGGREGLMRRFSWAPEDGVPVTQIQLYYAEAGRGYTATATVPSSAFSELELQLMDILEGLSVGGPNGAAGGTGATTPADAEPPMTLGG
jgi:hypothetical protein